MREPGIVRASGPRGGSACRARIPRTCAEYFLPCARESACRARWLTAAFLSRKDLHQYSRADPDDVVLVVTELVTNVICHTRSSCWLRLAGGPACVRRR